MSYVTCDHGIWYLREKNKNKESFGHSPPVKYIPQIIEGDAQVKIFQIQIKTGGIQNK